ncbi:MAG: glycosyltransferase family 39 protein [Spartobacteria bacterium]
MALRENSEENLGAMNDRHCKLLLAALTVAALAPFLNKAYDIDDPLFLWMAQQIVRHPLDPYGSLVHWASVAQPMWVAMQNPPLSSYYMAAFGSLLGFDEVVMHVAFLLPAIAAVLGTFVMARRFCESPVPATLLTLFTPVFFISATHVMCDVLLVAFWLWAIHFWMEGLDSKRWPLLLLSALLVSAATLTKYFGLSLVPLLFAWTVVHRRKLNLGLLYLTIPLLLVVAFELLTTRLYGQPLFSSAMLYLRSVAVEVRIPLTTKFLTGCSFTGGCMIGALGLACLRGAKGLLIGAALLLVVGFIFWSYVPLPAGLGGNALAVRLQGCLFATGGLAILGLALWDFRRRRDADSLLLLLWTLGTFVFATFFNWSITARTILPMAPAVGILLVRQWERGREGKPGSAGKMVWVAGAMVITMLVATADYYEADASRVGARYFEKRYSSGNACVWFQSHWGFQFYMQRWKAKPMIQNAPIRPGDLLIVPSNNADVLPLPHPAVLRREITRSLVPLVATFAPGTAAGFYSSVRGPVPWAFARTTPARFAVYKIR